MIRLFSVLMLLSASMAGAQDSPPQRASITAKEETALTARLIKARTLIGAHHADRAISDHLDPVIARYASAYGASKEAVFCAREVGESLYYLAAAGVAHDKGGTNQGVIVVGPTWADAYLMKGFALVELKNLPAAQDALQSAVKLSPQNPQYISELAYVTQQRGGSEDALALFRSAADAAEMIQDSARKRSELARACRGQGYALVELKKLDEGEAQYRACMKLDPSDKIAPSELDYISKVRAKR